MARPLGMTAAVLMLLHAVAAWPQTIASSGLAGREVFPGLRVGDVTIGVVFAGWTVADGADWQPISSQSGGAWSGAISYRGLARQPGRSAEIIDGYWALTLDGEAFGGFVVSGEVTWPRSDDLQWPCIDPSGTYPVARVEAVIGLGTSRAAAGAIDGCLDDIRWDPARPLQNIPRIWGTLRIGTVPVAHGLGQ